MPYCSQASVENYLIGYNAANTASANIVVDSITDATNEINKYLCQRYDVTQWATLTSTPPIITTICKWLAAGYAIEATSRGSKEQMKRSETLINRAMKDIEGIASGELNLVDSSLNEVSTSSDPNDSFSTTENYSNTFNEDDYLTWKSDTTKLTDILSERS